MTAEQEPDPFREALWEALAGAKSIAEAWALYEGLIIPAAAGEYQRSESRRVFYCAADWMLRRISEASAGDEDAACTLLSNFMRESVEFCAAIQRGEK